VDRRPYKKVAREEAQQRTRDALIDAANDAFFSDHWPKASLDALSAKAGVTKQTLLRHFGSKDELLVQALVRGATQVRDQRWSTPTDDIPGAVENLLEHYDAWGERSIRISAWQTNRPQALALLSRAARHIHHEWVDHAFAAWLDGLPNDARTERRAALIAVCDVQTWWTLSHNLELPRAQVRTILTDLIERLLSDGRFDGQPTQPRTAAQTATPSS
jgi:AcrR family transcriptional regulator